MNSSLSASVYGILEQLCSTQTPSQHMLWVWVSLTSFSNAIRGNHLHAVKNIALTQANNFYSLTTLKYLTPLTRAELGLATPLTTAASGFFSWQELWLRRRTSLRPHQTGDFSDPHSTSPQRQVLVKRVRKSFRGRGASVEQQWTAVRWDVVRPYVSKN